MLIGCFLLLNIGTWAQSLYPGQHQEKTIIPTLADIKANSFDLKDIKLEKSIFRDNMERASQWMLKLEVGQLLQSFRNTAGVFSAKEGGYMNVKKLGGWESLDCDLRGHSTGHILSALSYLYAATGDQRYKLKGDSLVMGLAEVQEALAEVGQKGYISAFPENLINRNIAGKSVWAPWYTLHKIYAGLIDQYLYAGNDQALEIMKSAAEWAYQKLMVLSDTQRKRMLRNEFGGVNEAFYNLYAITGDKRHQQLAEFFYHNDVIDPLLNQQANLYAKHANTFIPKVIGEARNYELNNTTQAKKIAQFFWQTVVDHQTYCTGGNSSSEKFIPDDELSKNLTGYTQETCNTNNMLKLTRHLFTWDADLKYMDFYERALYNHILGQQDPASGMVAYFLPLLPGAHKVYSTSTQSFWCCVGTGFENHTKYGEGIYYHKDANLFVNLFIPSTLNWKEKGVVLRQETIFPADDKVRFIINRSNGNSWTLQLRYPAWSSNVQVRVNGKSVKVEQIPSSYIKIERVWRAGDTVEVTYPMSLHLARTNDNSNMAAVMYGPLVLAGAMGTEGMKDPAPFSDPTQYNDYYTYDYRVPTSLKTSLHLNNKNLDKVVKRLPGKPLTFAAITADQHILLKPIHQIHHERYVVYWNLK